MRALRLVNGLSPRCRGPHLSPERRTSVGAAAPTVHFTRPTTHAECFVAQRKTARRSHVNERYSRPGESHGAAKLTVTDVALARMLARDQALPRGWIADLAAKLGVSRGALTMAIGGKTWGHMADPAPVGLFRQRHDPTARTSSSRPRCPTCGHAKHYAVLNGRPCRDKFHSIDHRQFTSARNLRKARLRD